MHPLKSKRQYSDRPPYTLGHSLGWSLDFHDLLIKQLGEEGIEPRFELAEAYAASNAQADTSPAGGYIAWVDGRVSAAY